MTKKARQIVKTWTRKLREHQARVASAKRILARHPRDKAIRRKWKPILKQRQALVASAKRILKRWDRGIDPEALRYVCPNLTKAGAEELSRVLTPAFRKYGITTAKRAAMAVAQFAHESAHFRTTTEYASGAAYEGRRDLGNVFPGDGRRYKGRGYIQITGRANYKAVSKAFGVDFIGHPARLAKPKYAALASCWWWKAHGLNGYADRRDVVGATRRINGGTNGLADRQALYARARKVEKRLKP